MILVPKERACSKLHDNDKNCDNFLVLLPIMKERKSVLELRTSPVQHILFLRKLFSVRSLLMCKNMAGNLAGKGKEGCGQRRNSHYWRNLRGSYNDRRSLMQLSFLPVISICIRAYGDIIEKCRSRQT